MYKILRDHISSFLLLIFLLFWLYYVLSIAYYRVNDPWSVGDWLINYQGGFIRRGLIGELAIQLNYHLGISLQGIIFFIKSSIYLLIAIFPILLLIRKKLSIISILLLAAPWCLMFDVWDEPGAGRKEILLIAYFSILLALLNYVDKKYIYLFLLISFPILVLIHEGLYFFLPYAYFFVFYDEKIVYKNAIGLFFTSTTAIVASLFFIGTTDHILSICNSVVARGYPEFVCSTAISDLTGKIMFRDHKFPEYYFLKYSALLLVSLSPFYLYNLLYRIDLRYKVHLTCFIFTIPLYLLAGDWGRWIHVSFTLSFFIILSRNQPSHKPSYLLNVIFIGFLLIYNFSWYLPRCCISQDYISSLNNRFHSFNGFFVDIDRFRNHFKD